VTISGIVIRKSSDPVVLRLIGSDLLTLKLNRIALQLWHK
jgi:hypothetical protein